MRVARAVNEGKLTKASEFDDLAKWLAKGIYKTDGDNIVHGFGGQVNLEVKNGHAILRYDHIPNDSPCSYFAVVHTISPSGFNNLSVDKSARTVTMVAGEHVNI